LLLPQPALAHARVVDLTPAPGQQLQKPPVQVIVAFSERVSLSGRGLTVVGPSGRRLDRSLLLQGNTAILDVVDGGQGTYTVSFSAVSRDTHPLSGRYSFSVGAAGAGSASGVTPELQGDLGASTPAGLVLQALARWLHLIGYALGFGVLLFGLVVLREPGDQRLLRVASGGVVLLLVAEPIALAGQAAGLGSFPFFDEQSLTDLLGSSFGLLLALRAGAALALWSLIGAQRQSGGWIPVYLAVGLGAALAAVDSASAHALRGPLPTWLSVPASSLHEIAMGIWLGGLTGTLITWRVDGRSGLISGFGRLAGLGILLLALSGAVLALGLLRSPGDLLGTVFGRSLSLKSLAFAAALGLAYMARRAGGLPRLWRAELALAALILGLAGLLVTLPPPR
jgi:copper transport protein